MGTIGTGCPSLAAPTQSSAEEPLVLASDTDPASLAGLEIVDRRGERIGRIRQVYADDGAVGWAGVRGNLIGTTEVLVPLAGADLQDDVVTLPISRSRFLSAPRRTPDSAPDDEERATLRSFYDETPSAPRSVAVVGPEREAPPAADDDVVADPAPVDEVVRSEQRIRVATEPVPRTRVVLRKIVVTEQRTITVPVRREEVRLVREPIVDGEPVPGAVLEESEHEFVLHEERVVVTTEVVPIERIRLVHEAITEEREVSGEVWRERIEPSTEPAGS